ncbi:MAG TPA: GNAT family N-acetyltransferase [Vulgatibacter sp.]|nr:GNAT family N-acetyltransferase [Vulgatibacter sp.]
MGEFIGPDDERWLGLVVAAPHDVYHLPAYAEVSAGACGGSALAFLGEVGGASCLIPLIETKIPIAGWSDWSDLSSPYGYGSPLLSGDPARFGALLRLFSTAAAARSCASIFLRSHPLLPPRIADPASFGVEWTPRGSTVSIDLRKPEEQLWKELRKDHRSGLRRLIAAGFTSRFDDWKDHDRFVELYLSTMSRVGARSSYLFSPRYFEDLRERLREETHLCTVLAPDGRIAAAAQFFRCGDLLQGHLMGWDEEFKSLAPAKLTVWEIARWGREAGASRLHLGGGLGGENDALLHYKSGYSRDRHPYHTLALVPDREVYGAICEAAGRLPDSAYFPAYRADAA